MSVEGYLMNGDQGVAHTHTHTFGYTIFFISFRCILNSGAQTVPSVRSSDRGDRSRVTLPSFLPSSPSFPSFSLYSSGSHGGRSARSERFGTISPSRSGSIWSLFVRQDSRKIHKLRTKSTWNYAESQLIRRPDRHRPISRVTFRPLFFLFFSFFGEIESKTRILGSEQSPGLRTLPNDSSAQ